VFTAQYGLDLRFVCKGSSDTPDKDWDSAVNHGVADSSKSLPTHYTIMSQPFDAISLDTTAALRK
jgi:hypothetical protein